MFVPNFCGMKTGVLPITEDNLKLLKSGYVKRRPEELAVLSRFVSLVSCVFHLVKLHAVLHRCLKLVFSCYGWLQLVLHVLLHCDFNGWLVVCYY